MSSQPYYNAPSSTPVVVQGVLVSNNLNSRPPAPTASHIYDHNHVRAGVGAMSTEILSHPNDENTGGNWTKGEVQPRRCNDAIFAILFYLHLGVIGWTTGMFAPTMFEEVAESANINGGRSLEEDKDANFDVDGNVDVRDFDGKAGTTSKILTWTIHSTHRLLRTTSSHLTDRSLQEEMNFDITGTNDFGDLMLLLGISAVVALVISTLALSFMISHAQSLIKFSLLFNIASTALVSSIVCP